MSRGTNGQRVVATLRNSRSERRKKFRKGESNAPAPNPPSTPPPRSTNSGRPFSRARADSLHVAAGT